MKATPTKTEIEAQAARIERRRKLRLELQDLADQESLNPAKYVDDQSAVAMARHRVEHCELAIRIYELEYPPTPEAPNWRLAAQQMGLGVPVEPGHVPLEGDGE